MKHPKIALSVGAAALISGALLTGAVANAAPSKPAALAAPLSSVTGVSVNVAPGGHGIASVTCPVGKIVTGGGGQTSAFDIFFTDSYASGNGWTIRGTNKGASTQTLKAVAICVG